MIETPLFFKNGNYDLFGVLHEAERKQRHSGIVVCHPFAEEKMISHRFIVSLARSLAREGFPCIRFDYMGDGDSSGDFEDSSIETRLSDIRAAAGYFKKRTGIEKVSLLGVRFGGTLAALASSRMPEVDSIALLAPVINGKTYFDLCLRSNLTTQMVVHNEVKRDRKQLIEGLLAGIPVNIDGYMVSKDHYQQMESIDLISDVHQLPDKILIMQILKDGKQPAEKEIEQLYARYESQGKTVELARVSEEFPWKDSRKYSSRSEAVTQEVLSWLNRIYS